MHKDLGKGKKHHYEKQTEHFGRVWQSFQSDNRLAIQVYLYRLKIPPLNQLVKL